ncbi:cytochrome P450 [Nonomuraea sp. NPDC049709]|uniref:cytochrome P450 n=1 Tax=Nonomuraea sp. NPDC049709 TaxID=3154736 RepID=UPI003414550F
MTEAIPVPHGLPIDRDRRCPFDPPPELARLRAERPISRMIYPDGHEGWLVTGYHAARALLADPRLSSRSENRRTAVLTDPVKTGLAGAGPGMISRMDPPEHTRLRRLLIGEFTVHRMKQLEPRIQELAEQHIDEMRRQGPPADLVQAYALPIPSLVICELLGVPYEDRKTFRHDSRRLLNLDTAPDEVAAAGASLIHYMSELIRDKRARPGSDLLSDLARGGELDDEEMTGLGMTLLVAGHETTANMLSLGTLALLEHPDQLRRLRQDPGLIDGAVEELMRYLSVVHASISRGALADIEIDGHVIKEGEVVTLSLPAANRDHGRFPDPDELDVSRSAIGHLAFGHGVHQCLGQQLARVEMRVGFTALLKAFPELRLAVPAEEIAFREHAFVYGVHRLPVTW